MLLLFSGVSTLTEMPQLARITATFFTTLLTRLGVRPPFEEGYVLSNVVQPITIVDSDIAIPASVSLPTIGSANSTGDQVAPAVNTILADTGALAAGTYNLILTCGIVNSTSSLRGVELARRDAANAADIWKARLMCNPNSGFDPIALRCSCDLNERFVLRTGIIFGAGETVQGNIFIGS